MKKKSSSKKSILVKFDVQAENFYFQVKFINCYLREIISFTKKLTLETKSLEKNWSSLKFRIENRNNRKSLKIRFLWKNDTHLYIQGDNSL